MASDNDSRAARLLVTVHANPILQKVGRGLYLAGMLVACLLRTFLHPAAQLRLMERFAEPFVRAWAGVWQPVMQFITTGIKRLASFL